MNKKNLLSQTDIIAPKVNRTLRPELQASSDSPAHGAYAIVDITQIVPDPNQPRKYFDKDNLEELARSIKKDGVVQPLVVRSGDNNEIVLVAGERRWKAALIAGLKEIPVIISTGDPVVISMIENIHRDDLRPIEKAEGIKRMIEEYGYAQDDVAETLSKSQSTISEYLSINNLPEKVKDIIRESPEGDRYPMRLLTAIAKQPTQDKMIAIFEQYEKGDLGVDAIRNISRKKRPEQPKVDLLTIVKRINGFQKFLEKNITGKNIKEIWDPLNHLDTTIQNLLYLDENTDETAESGK